MTQEETKAPELNISDLAAMRNLIEVVTQRGAFKGAELSAAGQLFDKLDAFLKAAEAQAAAAQAPADTAQPETPQGE